jgi:hypothetical protein
LRRYGNSIDSGALYLFQASSLGIVSRNFERLRSFVNAIFRHPIHDIAPCFVVGGIGIVTLEARF